MSKRLLKTCTCVALISSLWLSSAEAEPRIYDSVFETQPSREQQREWFKQAEYAAGRGRLAEYRQLLAQLEGYPLLPYLELERLQQVGYLANEERVLQFLERYQHTPMDWQLRRPWLDYLAEQGEAARFIRDFRAPGTTTHQCYHLRFQLQLETMPAAAVMRAVDQLWQTGSSLPKACDPLLARWAEAGHRTPELVWARVKLAAEGGNHTLIPYLTKLLPESQRYLAEHYRRVRRDPSQIVRLHYLRGDYPQQEAEIALYALGRLIWRDPDRAIRTYAELPEHIRLTPAQRIELEQKFAVALSAKDHDEAHIWVERIGPEDHDAASLQWKLAERVREADWPAIIAFTDQSQLALQHTGWRYWRARALASVNRSDEAKQLYAALAQDRNYYGFLAAAQLGQKFSLAAEPVQASASELQQLRDIPAIQRTYEFLKLERYLDARREWVSLLEWLPASQQQQLAVLANQWGWHDQAIFALATIGAFDAVALRFPQAYLPEHEQYAEAAGIDVTWALAISRRESAFRHDATSHAGAYGLMQLLPSTARQIERRRLQRHELFDVDTNVRLGTRYLGQLQSRLNGNWVLATAAYNGGIYRVLDWLPEQPMEADRWIETIPFRETRDYVKNVLAYQQIYHAVRQTPSAIFADVMQMRISRGEANP
ncbi:transglycosylase SLT domain-containing protein [Pseudidiomarina taiwanensis]|uniref:Murein transglycosylase n=1 Tax=Pseudidiomarina taiwanensis TaxID=337250 RepID=A0A432ZEP7_9GAMM|nr:transglycosylase SLT domain-containing protein [Pseudidiomarina taiwanensis]RUO76401.1 murein transglycosylase [Pseudidiomarina taiwanensis]